MSNSSQLAVQPEAERSKAVGNDNCRSELLYQMTKQLVRDPYVEMVKDGTYQVRVPVKGHALPHVFPYEFRTEEEAKTWLKSPTGCELVQKVRDKYAT